MNIRLKILIRISQVSVSQPDDEVMIPVQMGHFDFKTGTLPFIYMDFPCFIYTSRQ